MLLDHFRGCVFGTAIGDAIGYPVEFMDMDQIRRLGPLDRFVRYNNGVALVSDDTQMFLATARGLLDAGTWEDLDVAANAIAKRYAAWAESPENNRAPGNACMYGSRRLGAGVPWRTAGKDGAGGCGAAMRSMAYGLWFPGNPQAAGFWAGEHAALTHRSGMASASAAAVAAGVAVALVGAKPLEIADEMILAAALYDSATREMLQSARAQSADPSVTPEHILNAWRGWAGHEAAAASLYCFLRYPDHYIGAVSAACTSPGDSDSLGAITGALSGAALGFRKIPPHLAQSVELSTYLAAISDELSEAIDSLGVN